MYVDPLRAATEPKGQDSTVEVVHALRGELKGASTVGDTSDDRR